MTSEYQQALNDIRRAIWVECAETRRSKHIERKGLERALEIIDRFEAARKAQLILNTNLQAYEGQP